MFRIIKLIELKGREVELKGMNIHVMPDCCYFFIITFGTCCEEYISQNLCGNLRMSSFLQSLL